MNIKVNRNILYAILMNVVLLSGCNDNENIEGTSDLSFEMTSEILECNSAEEVNVNVGTEGGDYKLAVTASTETEWGVSLEGGAWISVNPVAKQHGNGEITITVSENTYNEDNRIATIAISNNADDKVYKYRFVQSYNSNYVTPEIKDFTYSKSVKTFTLNTAELGENITVETFADTEDDINKYNIIYEKDYEILPSACLNTAVIEDESLEISFNEEIEKLNNAYKYILPVSLYEEGKMIKNIWIAIYVESGVSIPDGNDLYEIVLTDNMVTTSSQRWSKDHTYLIDGKLDSPWQSIWQSGQNPKLDATYGVYIDITLGENTYEYLSFDYATGVENNNVPDHIKIYAGADKNSLTELAEYTRTEDNLPTASQTWLSGNDKSKLPIIQLNGINAKIMRISFLSSYDAMNTNKVNDLTDVSHNENLNQTHPAVRVAELKIYGK